eukprot:Gregarina_sp_Poly_1__7322@NODE_402_length_8871_cov_33_281236_g328_i0_p3_GENE_NODE_402_length_8871_cov_33_281236_g328_i0NODE_402_length_8871_cov_33_281236_g328_i0_p3_ORF_typecomplete_len141_score2_20Tir_receptor_C/PF07489_11/0_1_NODE_402_length_8871_cov_33_281236_g328_i0510932
MAINHKSDRDACRVITDITHSLRGLRNEADACVSDVGGVSDHGTSAERPDLRGSPNSVITAFSNKGVIDSFTNLFCSLGMSMDNSNRFPVRTAFTSICDKPSASKRLQRLITTTYHNDTLASSVAIARTDHQDTALCFEC